MGKTKHEKSFVDFEMPYEQNVIGLKGIIYFGIGMVALIVVTFALMWALLGVLEDNAQDTKKSDNPMMLGAKERLPPEPRVQLAPGFGVDGPHGRVNLELREPQAEWRELHAQWMETWKNGTIDKATGAITAMPIEEAKARVVGANVKAKSGSEAEKLAADSQMIITDASAGRVASLKRR